MPDIERPENQISLRISTNELEQSGLVGHARSVIGKDEPLKRRLGEEKFSLLTDLVISLLSSETLDRAEVMAKGIDPEVVLKKAKTLLKDFRSKSYMSWRS